ALQSLMSLGDPIRRRLYEAVAAERRAMSRNELAKATGIARPLAAYHLERLVKDGLLEARFERQTGRTGPGAGRPAKLYFRSKSTVNVSLPARAYEVAAHVLLEAEARRSQGTLDPLLEQTAQRAGEELASENREPLAVLTDRGYEPQTGADGVICLRNCVFDELAEQERAVVCGMNLALIRGVLQALPESHLEARLDPAPDRCCVVLSPSGASSGERGDPKM
ncbi:MAG TPA: helix-turn-helix domain-containing protein, partial [Dehalococcoidia bacterium]|nr:helix-turn-helix domain-containing protein [Dehalococcoidia bacterium]